MLKYQVGQHVRVKKSAVSTRLAEREVTILEADDQPSWQYEVISNSVLKSAFNEDELEEL